MFVGMTWEELRLIGPSGNTSSMTTVDNSFADNLWLPDIYIYSMKHIEVPKYNSHFAGEFFF
jgi:hypothetical protein